MFIRKSTNISQPALFKITYMLAESCGIRTLKDKPFLILTTIPILRYVGILTTIVICSLCYFIIAGL